MPMGWRIIDRDGLPARDPHLLPFYPAPTQQGQPQMPLQQPKAEQVGRASAQFPASSWYPVSTPPPVGGRSIPNMDPSATPTDSATIEPCEHPSAGLPQFQAVSLLEQSPTASGSMAPARSPPRTMTRGRDLPGLQITKWGESTTITLQPGQPIPGTMPSPTDQRPPLRTRRESHPFYHSSIFPNGVLEDTVNSYNRFWPYLLSPRRHTVHIPESDNWDEKSLYRAYLYRNRYPTLLTLTLLFLSLLPFIVLFIMLSSCYNVGKHPRYNPQMRDYCNTSNVLTAMLPLSTCVAACWITIWAFRERVVIFWLSMSQDNYKWKYIPATVGTVLLSWGAFEGPGLEELHAEGILAPQGEHSQASKAPKPTTAPGKPAPSVRPGTVVHWSDLGDTIENGTLEDLLSPPEVGALYNITLPKAQIGLYSAHVPRDSLEGIELHGLDPQQEKYLDPDSPGLTQEEKLRRWKEMRRRELYCGLDLGKVSAGSLEERKRPAETPLAVGSSAGGWDGWVSRLDKRATMLKGKNMDKGKGRATDVPVPRREFDISAPII